jgi:phage terminase small subunit
MGARGALPLPKETLAARGSWRADLPAGSQPDIPALEALPKCPTRVKGEARKEWKRTGGELVRLRLLSSLDLGLLEDFCVLHARKLDLEARIESAADDEQLALINAWNRCADQIARLRKEFGMGRNAAGRVMTARPEKPAAPADPKERFFARPG